LRVESILDVRKPENPPWDETHTKKVTEIQELGSVLAKLD
jgi:hypothetical protein